MKVHSILGLSDSPVFVSLPHYRVVDHIKSEEEVGARILFLLGVVRGHWSDRDILAELLGPSDRRPSKPTNKEFDRFQHWGMAFVTPFQEVVKVLMDDRLNKERRKGTRESPADKCLAA